ncbi:MAG: DUF4070 domain-containing protein [Calditrichaceae bacterium]|nr:DUF4070 domain-containing protein [Calditrichaceae bacterium]MBN2708676.1 DUF4070 domain-containing protein [Calditrichaceae bacterium]RQV96763.1 MAG: DUF4070 domain-containing protein [Calditrichota bacterium]
MNILLIYPKTPSTFWSFQSALNFISKKSSEPPLGLLTIASFLPSDWNQRLIDLNVTEIKNDDILWADYVFLSGMNIHRNSFMKVVRRCNELGTPVVAGGPLITTEHQQFLGIDHFILGEAEAIMPELIKDLSEGHPKPVYEMQDFPELSTSPVPLWRLLDMDKYASMSVQYSRGCPYNCEFCSITILNGHRPRTKSAAQFVAELESLYQNGWRGHIFIVDDNFIGNKKKLKTEFLPELIRWNNSHNHVFTFGTETSINLADDDELMRLMVDAGFESTFIGIESPNEESLAACGKKQNLNRDLLGSVKKLHKSGLKVSAGFILGFDQDPADIFERQIDFIRKSGIATAMVGLLNAPTGTRLCKRLKKENRLLETMSGDNMDGSINFIPKMNYKKLVAGYKNVLQTIYSQKEYYERVKTFLKDFQPRFQKSATVSYKEIKALLKSIWILGLLDQGKRYYWRLFFMSLFKCPKKFPIAITLAVYGFHFRKVVEGI